MNWIKMKNFKVPASRRGLEKRLEEEIEDRI
jgi:hypothetical protein